MQSITVFEVRRFGLTHSSDPGRRSAKPWSKSAPTCSSTNRAIVCGRPEILCDLQGPAAAEEATEEGDETLDEGEEGEEPTEGDAEGVTDGEAEE